jgi:polyketide cyclase/dehydrase/lipid transport protein
MSTLRTEALIARDPDDVWKVVTDAGTISDWFPLIKESRLTGSGRPIVLQDGTTVDEAIVTNDAALRRFQYRIVGGDIPLDYHLGTVDIIGVAGQSLLVYSTEISPDALADVIGPAVAEAVANLAGRLG